MKALTARDALSTAYMCVSGDARPQEILNKVKNKRIVTCAVFDKSTFLGLVDWQDILQTNPQRIFADLLPEQPTPAVPEDVAIEEVSRRLNQHSACALPVFDRKGTFIGVVSRESLLHVLLQKHDHLLKLTEKVKDLVQEIYGTLDLKAMLRTALRQTLEMMGLKTGWIFLYEDRSKARLVTHVNLPRPYLKARQAALKGDCLCQREVLEYKKEVPILCVKCERAQKLGRKLKYHITIPLVSFDKAMGIMNLACPEAPAISNEELSILTTLGKSIGTAIMNTQSFHKLEADRKRLAIWSQRLSQLHKTSTQLLSLIGTPVLEDRLLQEGIESICMLVEAKYGAIGLFDSKGELVKFIHTGLTREEKSLLKELPKGKGILGLIDRENRTLRLKDLTKHPSAYGFPPHHPVMKTFLGVPISLRGKVYGHIYLTEKIQGRPFTREDEKVASIYAQSLALAIENAHMIEKLATSEEKYRRLFEESKDAVFMSTPAGKLLDINPAGVELFGYNSKEELLTTNISQDLYFDPREREKYERALARHGFVKDYELVLKRKDGQKLFVLESAVVVRDEHGKIVGYRGIIHDITERKNLEEQLLQAQKMETIGTLTGGVAHEFNNLLTVILGNAEFGLQVSNPTDAVYQDLLRIEKAAIQARDLTRQLLSFSRRQVLNPELLNLNKSIEELLKMLKRIIGEDIELKTKLTPKLAPIWADPVQVQQVLLNLCVNARDAMPGGGQLILETRNAARTFGVDEELSRATGAMEPSASSKKGSRNYVQLNVMDTGAGMDQETQARIFEPFFTTKEVGKGTGLGLSVVYGIVKQHQGHIEVNSEVGKGTTFKIYFPAVSEPEAADQRKKKGPSVRGGNETILVVEDEEAVRNVAVRILKKLGYNVLTAQDGIEAAEVFETEHDKVDLVIMDLVMPKESGTQTCTKMRAIKPNLPVLLVTGYEYNVKIKDLCHSEEEPIRILQKPFTLETLGKTVRELLDQMNKSRKYKALTII